MKNCLFCKIANKKTETEILFEDKNFAVFKDIRPKAPLHLLIVPKKHINSLNELKEKNKEFLGEMILRAVKIAQEKGRGEGYRLMINTGKKSGQEIDHLHLHLLGF